MNIETLIVNRLSLQATQNHLYNITKCDITNLKELHSYVLKLWSQIDSYKQHQIIQVLGGNYSGKGKNLKLVENYINKLNHESA